MKYVLDSKKKKKMKYVLTIKIYKKKKNGQYNQWGKTKKEKKRKTGDHYNTDTEIETGIPTSPAKLVSLGAAEFPANA